MEMNYSEAFFINPGIEAGISEYIKYKNGLEYNKLHTFEMYVIKALTIIYGEKSILLPYKIDNERAFECNLLMYNLKESEMYDFIRYMNDYHEFMVEFNSNTKANGIIYEIEKILMNMIIKRSKRKEFTQAEIDEFDTIFNPLNGDLKRIKLMLNNSQGLIVRFWENKKDELTNTQLRMMAINPNLLNPNIYSKFGLNIKDIAMLSNVEIENLNKKIMDEENRVLDFTQLGKRTKRKRILLTSGNGFVDALVILSIIATELMIGTIALSFFGGFIW